MKEGKTIGKLFNLPFIQPKVYLCLFGEFFCGFCFWVFLMSSPESYCVFCPYKKVQPKINKIVPQRGKDLNTVFNTERSQFRIQFPKH